jgi:hypothetical protein
MRNIVLILFFMAYSASAQVKKFAGIIIEEKTTAQLNALPSVLKVGGSVYRDSDKGFFVTWDALLGDWVGFTSGSGNSWTDPVDSNILPDADGSRSLGSGVNRFGSVYASAGYFDELFIDGSTAILEMYRNSRANYGSSGVGAMWVEDDGSPAFGTGGSGQLAVFSISGNTAKRTYTMPDKSGVLATLDDLSGGSTDDQTGLEVFYDNTTYGGPSTNVQDALDYGFEKFGEHEASFNLYRATTFEDETTVTYTLLNSDRFKKKRFNNVSEITVSEPAVKNAGDNYRLVRYGPGAVKLDFPVHEIAGEEIYVIIEKNAFLEWDGEKWDITGNYTTYTFDPNQYPYADAANDANEVNSAIGWENYQGTASMTSSDIGVIAGNYSLKAENGNLVDNSQFGLRIALSNVNAGDTVTLTIWVEETIGTNFQIGFYGSQGWSTEDYSNTDPGAAKQYTYIGVAGVDAPYLRIGGTSGSDIGDVLTIDSIFYEID